MSDDDTRLRDIKNGYAQARARIGDLERALAAERQTATLNAEGHAREIRQLQDMVEAEVEARREAERDHTDMMWQRQRADERVEAAEAELAGWKRVAVEAAIPLEALRMARPASDFSPAVRDGIEHAIGIIRRAVMGQGLPPPCPTRRSVP